jgi:endonuclease/exonuclease/phosphatase family metal-dependent hydrolase
MHRLTRVVPSLLFALAIAAPAAAGPAPNRNNDKTVTVMTWNLYYGANLDGAIAAIAEGDPEAIVAAVSELWGVVGFTDFPSRAQALAAEIERVQPDLIGFQEAALWRSDPYDGSPEPNASHVEYDFAQLLIDALEARDLHYALVAAETGFDAEFPGFLSMEDFEAGDLSDIRLTDREIILARTDLKTSELKLSNPRSGNFETNFSFPVGEGEFVLLRGWASVDAKIRGKSFRFVTTHLEDESLEVRNAQAVEILTGPADTNLPVVLVMDANSNANADPSTQVYAAFEGDGFVDTWFEAHPGSLVTTCCNAPDLTNPVFPEPGDDEGRIDLVLYRGTGQFRTLAADILGTDPDADRVLNSMGFEIWPTDHAGLSATLEIHN